MANSKFGGIGISGEKTVSAAGTAEALGTVSANPERYKSLTIIAKATNTNNVYLGGSDVASTTNDGLPALASLTLQSEYGFLLSEVYIDVDTSGEGVDFYAAY